MCFLIGCSGRTEYVLINQQKEITRGLIDVITQNSLEVIGTCKVSEDSVFCSIDNSIDMKLFDLETYHSLNGQTFFRIKDRMGERAIVTSSSLMRFTRDIDSLFQLAVDSNRVNVKRDSVSLKESNDFISSMNSSLGVEEATSH